jgi:hypothetical protein
VWSDILLPAADAALIFNLAFGFQSRVTLFSTQWEQMWIGWVQGW